jgi:hypothetical protein
MMKKRVAIPEKLKNKILKEYHYKCAICGVTDPQLHHIDEDPSNNDPKNIIPLCPNCHLIDLHNPTEPMDPRKLSLFRTYKDPTILSPQFHPLFKRIMFLLNFESDKKIEGIDDEIRDLVGFISLLEMGAYYSQKIHKMLERHTGPNFFVTAADYGQEHLPSESESIALDDFYVEQLTQEIPKVVELTVELLRFQPWGLKATPVTK